ncbi:RHS repeat-associated core domain-containing protein [Solimicrobium silvestre]|uniref:RHS repeat-associated core domain n=1 Tax=Solimicrobium silvestre TaxID=2099400 RepID=A0A2S9GS68_9BURK|nr:RHS repeat-associated core domain-containing protein [Solimicrobium silvestre]PRC90562.1 RHS repeat-associated core domain [Solimicrobium silvestre]
MYGKSASGSSLDAETNLHQNYYRNYDPNSGRYIESDPLGLGGGISTYGYVGGNPLSFDDPFGLCITQAQADAISAGLGGFVGGYIGSGGKWQVGVLTGVVGGIAGYISSDTGISGNVVAGTAGGIGYAAKGGGGVPGIIGNGIAGFLINGLASTATQTGTENTSGGALGGTVGGLITGLLMKAPIGNNVNPILGAGYGFLGGLAAGLTQDFINDLLKSQICTCDKK